jgi:hypothetical protein
MVMEDFLTSVQVEQEDFEVVFMEINESETSLRGIPRNAMFMERVFLDLKIGVCINPSHAIKVLRNISNALMEHLPLQQDPKSTAERYIKFL